MSNNNSGMTLGGMGLCDVLFIVFLILKLAKVITWSWWWVTAPLWIPVGIVLGAGIIALVIFGIIALVAK